MRLQIIKSKNAQSLYVVKSVYHNKKRTNKVVEKLGTYENLKESLNNEKEVLIVKDNTNLEKEVEVKENTNAEVEVIEQTAEIENVEDLGLDTITPVEE